MAQLVFKSSLAATPQAAWAWITSVKGISAELAPVLRMSVPPGIDSLADVAFKPGQALFRSTVYLFGVIPVDYSDLTLLALNPGVGFIEQSPMGSMRSWRHERSVETAADGCVVMDVLTFEPRFAKRLSAWMVRRLFEHRHAVLRRRLGQGGMA